MGLSLLIVCTSMGSRLLNAQGEPECIMQPRTHTSAPGLKHVAQLQCGLNVLVLHVTSSRIRILVCILSLDYLNLNHPKPRLSRREAEEF